jgi:UDP-3-O-[3-hydroxymyristoyl] glucosamine N-acyltransferase
MKITASQIAQQVGGRVVGDGARGVTGISSLENAGPDDLSFVKDRKLAEAGRASQAGVLLTAEEIPGCTAVQVVVKDSFLAFVTILEDVARERSSPPPGISPDARIATDARLAKGVVIGAFAVIGDRVQIGEDTIVYPGTVIGADCTLGRDCILHANVTLYHRTVLGDRVIVHSGTVIGADGYGYLQRGGRHVKIPQVGNVVIESDVEVGAHTTIDRAALDSTIIRRGVKIDDHVHVAHNCVVGEHSLLVGGSKMSGSSKLGKYVVLAGNVGVSDNLTLGDGAMIGAGSSLFSNVEPGAKYFGMPARPFAEQARIQAILGKLPAAWPKIRKLIEPGPPGEDK